MDLCNPEVLRPLLERHGFHFSHSMGQNFLIDASVPERIADSSLADKDCGVLEIGPGIGCLTRQLAARAGAVVSVELDRSLLPILDETLSDCTNTEIISGDIMKTDLKELIDSRLPQGRRLVCANLPYNITTPVLTLLIDSGLFDSITVMIQREVAKRICAGPGSPDFGAYSLYCQYHTRTEYLFEVPPACFLPAPKVTSAVIRMTLLPQPPVPVKDEELLFRVIRAAFSMRRKTLLNGLHAAFGDSLGKDALRNILLESGLPEGVRGERMSLAEFAVLSDCLGQHLNP